MAEDAVGDEAAEEPDGDLGDGIGHEHGQAPREEDAAGDLVDHEHEAARFELLVEEPHALQRRVVRPRLELLELDHRFRVPLERLVEEVLVLLVRRVGARFADGPS